MGARGTCYRPIQKIMLFEVDEINKYEISEKCSAERCELREITLRRTATKGNNLEKLLDIYG